VRHVAPQGAAPYDACSLFITCLGIDRAAAGFFTWYALLMRINWRDVLKFLSGAFFVTAGASWYFWWHHVSVPLPFGLTMTPEFLGIRGLIHFALFLISLYFGFIRK
jgi:hypothetical protein